MPCVSFGLEDVIGRLNTRFPLRLLESLSLSLAFFLPCFCLSQSTPSIFWQRPALLMLKLCLPFLYHPKVEPANFGFSEKKNQKSLFQKIFRNDEDTCIANVHHRNGSREKEPTEKILKRLALATRRSQAWVPWNLNVQDDGRARLRKNF